MECSDIAQLPERTQQQLARYGFDHEAFCALRARLRHGQFDNVAKGAIAPAAGSDVTELPALATPLRALLTERGEELIRDGAVGVVILCGGMATRFGGVVKANIPVRDGATFLDLKLVDIEQVAQRLGGRVPVYLMTSFATDTQVTRAVEARSHERVPVTPFTQFISMRLTPSGNLFLGKDGLPSLYATGHGDLAPALRKSGCLHAMASEGVKHILMSNVDNLGATLDPAVIGAHAAHSKAMTFEVTDSRQGDQGGAPLRVDGKLQVLEAFRVPPDLDPRTIPLFSTNSFVLDVAALDRDFDCGWFKVDKVVDGRTAIQFERLVNTLSACLSCHALRVRREGEDNRFIPIKAPNDLEAQRARIERVLRLRGALRT